MGDAENKAAADAEAAKTSVPVEGGDLGSELDALKKDIENMAKLNWMETEKADKSDES